MARKKTYAQMTDEELHDENLALQEEKDAIRDAQLKVNAEMSRRATDKRVRRVVGALSPEDQDRVAQVISEVGAIQSEENSGSKR